MNLSNRSPANAGNTPMGTAILQARIGSTRLPGKALMDMGGKPMLWYSIRTLQLSPAVRQVVVAVPDTPGDRVLLDLVAEMGAGTFSGSEQNVLERFYLAARAFPDEYYFRATGDNPILDIRNPERSLKYLIENRLDYACESKLPVGCVSEVFTAAALEKTFREGTSPEDIEHVTWYMKKSGQFRIEYFSGPSRFQYPQLSLTVDYPEDFQRVSQFIGHLYRDGHIPPFEKIIQFARESGM